MSNIQGKPVGFPGYASIPVAIIVDEHVPGREVSGPGRKIDVAMQRISEGKLPVNGRRPQRIGVRGIGDLCGQQVTVMKEYIELTVIRI